MRKELIGLSKFISLVLRHRPETIGIQMDNNGWVEVKELVEKSNEHQKSGRNSFLTKEILDEIVATNEKKRFSYSEDGLKIRASQGHSIGVDLALSPKDPPEFLYHGTADRFLDSIKKDGLKRMNRDHVHLSSDLNTVIKVGQRHGKPEVLKINSKEMQKDGFKFYLSENNVWLTESVPSKYIIWS